VCYPLYRDVSSTTGCVVHSAGTVVPPLGVLSTLKNMPVPQIAYHADVGQHILLTTLFIAPYCYGKSVRPSVRLSVSHTLVLYHIAKLFPSSVRGMSASAVASAGLNTRRCRNFAIFDRHHHLSQ